MINIKSILKDHCVIPSKYQSVYPRGGMADDSTNNTGKSNKSCFIKAQNYTSQCIKGGGMADDSTNNTGKSNKACFVKAQNFQLCVY